MSKLEIEIAGMVLKEGIRRILEEYAKTGRYRGNHSSHQLSIWERRYGPARGTAHRALPDPHPHERRRTDFDSKSKAA
jgi:hypothetical protein